MHAPGAKRQRTKVLFLCTGNSCRSQMAEGWLRHMAGERFEVASAGTRPQGLNPRAVAAMAEAGVDIAAHTSDSVERYLAEPPDLVVTVCDAAAEACPTFPGRTRIERWSFPDPALARGSEADVQAVFRDVRERIRARIERWLAEQGA